jgi:hypothetical protein
MVEELLIRAFGCGQAPVKGEQRAIKRLPRGIKSPPGSVPVVDLVAGVVRGSLSGTA